MTKSSQGILLQPCVYAKNICLPSQNPDRPQQTFVPTVEYRCLLTISEKEHRESFH